MQFIGRLMRDVDPVPIRAQARAVGSGAERRKSTPGGVERWRERLLADAAALDQLCAASIRPPTAHGLRRSWRACSDERARAAAAACLSRAVPHSERPVVHGDARRDASGATSALWPETADDRAVASLIIGLVSISDRASAGVYEDKGIPGLTEWFGAALTTPWRMETRLIPDEQPVIERTLIELVDTRRLPSGADDRRHRTRAARRDAGGDACGRAQGAAGLRRADAPGQPQVRADGDSVAPGRRRSAAAR